MLTPINEPYPSTEPTRACMGCGKIATIKQRFGRMVFYCCEEHAEIEPSQPWTPATARQRVGGTFGS